MTDRRGRESLGQPVDASGRTFEAICPHPPLPLHPFNLSEALEGIFALAGGTSCPQGLSVVYRS